MGTPRLSIGLGFACVVVACAAETNMETKSPRPAAPAASTSVVPSASASAATSADASTTPAPPPPPQPTASTAPWCNESYDNAPCVFRSYGACVEKTTKGKRISEEDFAYGKCPPGNPPAFMDRQMACGRRANEPIVPVRSNNMPNDASCNKISTAWANVLHDDRTCTTDADCTVVSGDGGCQNMAIAKRVKRKELELAPCGNPASGACAGAPSARCFSGCCMLATGGWGTMGGVYPKPALP